MGCGICSIVNQLKAVMVMMLVQIILAVANIFYKLAIKDGMNIRVLIAYRYLFAAGLMVPLAFFVERKIRPKLTWMVIFQAFLCGLFGGTLVQNLYMESVYLSSATFAVTMTNLIPATTLILSVAIGMEKLEFWTVAGKAKVVGTIISLGGATVITFYKGAVIDVWPVQIDLIGHTSSSYTEKPVDGTFMGLGSCFCFATWLIIQTKMSERYPCHLSSAALMCTTAALQSVVLALCTTQNKWEDWKLGWNVRLWTVAYVGIMPSAMLVTLVSWAVKAKGPLFVSAFNPVTLIQVALMASLLLDEKLHQGSVVGAVMIIIGLYVVLWGKGKEMKIASQPMSLSLKNYRESEKIDVIVVQSPSSSTVTEINISSTKL